MKNWLPGLIIGISFMLLMFCIPQSCDNKIDSLERKSEKSLIIDSIISAQTEKHNAELDSIINIKKHSDSIQKAEIKTLSKKYYALRAIIKTLDKVKVDSANQVVNGVPIEAYNASINSGNMCDELLLDLNESLDRKDSIISMREIQIVNNSKVIASKEKALTDLIALNEETKRQSEKSHKLNKRIPIIAAISAMAGSILTIQILK